MRLLTPETLRRSASWSATDSWVATRVKRVKVVPSPHTQQGRGGGFVGPPPPLLLDVQVPGICEDRPGGRLPVALVSKKPDGPANRCPGTTVGSALSEFTYSSSRERANVNGIWYDTP